MLEVNLQPNKVRIKRPHLLRLSKWFSFLRDLPLGIEAHQPGSIVHFPQIVGCGMMLWNPYYPSVATVHDLGVLELPEEWQMLDPIARQILRLSLAGLKKVDLVVTDSEFTRQGVMHHLGLPAERVVTVYLGIDHAVFHPIKNARELLLKKFPELASRSGAWLLYVGSELPRKNLATMFKALAIVKQRYPDVCLLKVGSAGGERFREQTMATIQRLGIEETVVFMKGISDTDLARLYAAADLFVQPSKLEGFGFPVLEAMACGTPVVCADSSSLPEVVGDAAVLVNADQPYELAQAILFMLKDSETQSKMSQKGIVRASAFTWQHHAEQMVEVYRSLAYEGMAQTQRSYSGKV